MCTKEEVQEIVDKSQAKILENGLCSTNTEKIENLEKLVFKMATNVDEMHKVFTSANWMIRFALKTFGAIGVITGSIVGVIELVKRMRPH